MYKVTPIPAFQDNYIWKISLGSKLILVDPGDADVVLKQLNSDDEIVGILVTHYHRDHTGGIAALKQEFPNIQVYGPSNSPYPNIDVKLNDQSQIYFEALNLSFNIITIPGHTLDHIAFYNQDWIFCGDTLFSAGCGRMFEGNPQMFLDSIKKLTGLNQDAQLFCTHEYTLANIEFALTIEANNQDLIAYQKKVVDLRALNLPSLPSSIRLEKLINPYLRCNSDAIKIKLSKLTRLEINSEVDAFATIRQLKDDF
ncbi:hydroxyacylglutathione hydrolase [Catenovulum maritimum]|uniref:Hydroxyacylglutathione hydrolase n=2 Tax=Catenovulum maritimum TaxID=1513271 RepID=A0A0J8GZ09_9ALTE|nr:hydroxyacylglutathione hydrolase [Catenovulum maritimum]